LSIAAQRSASGLTAWLYQRQPVFAHQIDGQWLDIGSFETLEQANREFA
jgi:NDP-sugar pyrophosphorylase family protein